MTCAECVHSKLLDRNDITCRRYPPVPILNPVGEGQWEVRSFWPSVSQDASCGEFKAKEQE